MTASPVVSPSLLLTAVLLSLVVIYLTSKAGGEICHRLDLPPVLGELIGGVMVGVSLLHLLVLPGGSATSSWLLAFMQFTGGLGSVSPPALFQAQGSFIDVLAELGVVILLFEVGLQSDLQELLRVGPLASLVAVVGVVVPFALGTLGLMGIFGVATVPAVFAGAALTATSIGITAKVLSQVGHLNTQEGQIILGAAVLDDVLGIMVLAVVAGLARTGQVDLYQVVHLLISAVVFLGGAIFVGRWFSPYLVALINRLRTRGQLLLSAFVFAFSLAYIAQVIQLEAILGAFAAGLVLAETEKRQELEHQVLPVADMLVPVFFVTVGAQTDLGVLTQPGLGLGVAFFLVAVAIGGKLVTALVVPARLNRLAVGVGMMPRGEVGLVFLSIGSATHILPPNLQAAIVLVVIATTLAAPPLLRGVFARALPH